MSDRSAIEHILDHCTTIEEFMLEGSCKTLEDFISNRMLHDAVLIHLLDIGELIIRHISEDFKNQYRNDVDWHGAAGLRNIVAHRYNTVKFGMIWEIISNELPEIKRFCEQQLQNSSENSNEDEDEPEFEP